MENEQTIELILTLGLIDHTNVILHTSFSTRFTAKDYAPQQMKEI